jgi:hypothetical protein
MKPMDKKDLILLLMEEFGIKEKLFNKVLAEIGNSLLDYFSEDFREINKMAMHFAIYAGHKIPDYSDAKLAISVYLKRKPQRIYELSNIVSTYKYSGRKEFMSVVSDTLGKRYIKKLN